MGVSVGCEIHYIVRPVRNFTCQLQNQVYVSLNLVTKNFNKCTWLKTEFSSQKLNNVHMVYAVKG